MTLSTQFATMLAMISMGVFFGASLDTYNRFLQRNKRKNWLVFINDILFMLFQGLIVFYSLFKVNQGELRFYIFLALLCGFAAYQSLLKQLYLNILEKMIRFTVAAYRFIVKMIYLFVYKPIYILITTLIALGIGLGRGLWGLMKWLFKLLLHLMKLVFKPVQWLLYLFWKLLPKKIKKTVEKLYNKVAGVFSLLKKYYNHWLKRWKKK